MSREIVANVLGEATTAKIWTGNYPPVLGFTPQDFSMGAVLPLVLYMFRWGSRRGKGFFTKTFKADEDKWPTIGSVAKKLTNHGHFDGFSTDVETRILGDLLLTFTLENKRHAEGHSARVARCFASHYSASWIDLPETAANVRGVPELIVAAVADQRNGEFLQAFIENGKYPVGCWIEDNSLLRAFSSGMSVEGDFKNSKKSDRFDEKKEIGVDQILALRIAQLCGAAPNNASGKANPAVIPNQHPISTRATSNFRKDFTTFLESYGASIPRLALLEMLETCFAIGLTTITLSIVPLIEQWEESGSLPEKKYHENLPIFVDCSSSEDRSLRNFSEQSGDFVRQRLARVPTVLIYMRLIENYVRQESDIPRNIVPVSSPSGRDLVNLLGAIATGVHSESRDAERSFRKYCRGLADALEEENPSNAHIALLREETLGRPSGLRLAEVLGKLIMRGELQLNIQTFLSSCLMTDQPNGLARRRRVTYTQPRRGKKTGYAHSFILSNTALEYLVHRHLRRDGKLHKSASLSLPEFIDILRERYGFCIDRPPPDMDIPSELLQRNRRILERRLRDLGMLIGVNDAERMKRLRQRYAAVFDEAARDNAETEAVQA